MQRRGWRLSGFAIARLSSPGCPAASNRRAADSSRINGRQIIQVKPSVLIFTQCLRLSSYRLELFDTGQFNCSTIGPAHGPAPIMSTHCDSTTASATTTTAGLYRRVQLSFIVAIERSCSVAKFNHNGFVFSVAVPDSQSRR